MQTVSETNTLPAIVYSNPLHVSLEMVNSYIHAVKLYPGIMVPGLLVIPNINTTSDRRKIEERNTI
jgi:hypothetical protein